MSTYDFSYINHVSLSQGLGKTVSVIALIQIQKSLLIPKMADPCVSDVEVK